ncbi:MAG: autotransporter-associated beta strand repeat-containing protein [Planctomycetes bacterium]|nr:autotransporter-associated beta strand repeat-containing protein [Planctomycetota bacterium]
MAAVVLAMATCGDALAQTRGSWNVDADGNWSLNTNWLNNTIAGGVTGTATFANNITATRTVTLDTARSLGSFIFGDADTSSAASWIVSGTAPMTMNNGTNSATITVNNLGTGATVTISSTLADSGTTPSIIKNGVGTLVLAGTNTFTTKLAITSGTLQFSADRNLGAVGAFATDRITISNGATLRTSAAVSLSGSRGLTIGSGGGTINVNGGNLTMAARVTGAGNTATVTGSNALILQNTSGTATDVNWDFSSNSGVRTFFEGANALGTGSARVRGGVRLTSQNVTSGTLTNAVTLDSGAGLTARSTGGALTYTNVTLPAAGSVLLNSDDQVTSALTISSGGTLTGDLTVSTQQGGTNSVGAVMLAGVLSGSGGLVKSGTGSSGVVILGAANTYTGATTINTGTLALSGSGSLASTGTVNVAASGATFDISGITASSLTIGALSGTAGSVVTLGSKLLTVGDATSSTFAGGIGGTGGLTKTGAGTLTLSASNAYSGTTTVSAGALSIANADALAGGGNVTFSGGTLRYGSGITTDLSGRIKSSGGAVAIDTGSNASVTFASAIDSSNVGGLTKSGTGMLVLNAANAYTGNTTISTGTLRLGVAGSIATSGTISVASGAWFDTALVPGGFSLASSQWLQGSGTVLGNVSAQGTLSPGLSGSVGTLSFANDLSLGSGSILSYGLNGANTTAGGGINDLSAITGNLTLDGTLNVSEIGVGSFLTATVGNTWRLFTYNGTLTNNGLSLGSTPTLSSGLTLAVDTSTPNEVNLIVVPEPAATAAAVLGVGLVAFARMRRRYVSSGRCD